MPIPFNIMKIKDSLENSASSAVKKTEEFIEISKLNLEISNEEKDIKEIYEKIGKKIYGQYEKDKALDRTLIKFCKDIKEIKNRISNIQKKILKVQYKKICPLCGKEVEHNAAYCEYCGLKQKK
ncbi:zinc ribbon domain-containing protein [Clostridium sp.]|uniref:zinc ribbon domain-containing protein n=1 Tax=Clostridium sp. TaxID=1506 RepID=UPI00258B0FE5|nr:zinc ribbon domain-containing protein [Clostridium sp.]MDF2503894.1 hypothetical protein [Clostridium sp.]